MDASDDLRDVLGAVVLSQHHRAFADLEVGERLVLTLGPDLGVTRHDVGPDAMVDPWRNRA